MKIETKKRLRGIFINCEFFKFLILFILFITISRVGQYVDGNDLMHWVTYILIAAFMMTYQLDRWRDAYSTNNRRCRE